MSHAAAEAPGDSVPFQFITHLQLSLNGLVSLLSWDPDRASERCLASGMRAMQEGG